MRGPPPQIPAIEVQEIEGLAMITVQSERIQYWIGNDEGEIALR